MHVCVWMPQLPDDNAWKKHRPTSPRRFSLADVLPEAQMDPVRGTRRPRSAPATRRRSVVDIAMASLVDDLQHGWDSLGHSRNGVVSAAAVSGTGVASGAKKMSSTVPSMPSSQPRPAKQHGGVRTSAAGVGGPQQDDGNGDSNEDTSDDDDGSHGRNGHDGNGVRDPMDEDGDGKVPMMGYILSAFMVDNLIKNLRVREHSTKTTHALSFKTITT
jgi:hypothetical protein